MVSIHKVPVIVHLIIRVISSTFRFKRGCYSENIHAFLLSQSVICLDQSFIRTNASNS